jgi:TonB family protein
MRTFTLIAILTFRLAAQEIAHDTALLIQSKVEPEYSEEARQARLEGTSTVSLIVGADGIPRNLKTLRSLGLGLDENAIAAVGKWRFQAATKNGDPVDTKTQVEVNFRLLDDLQVPWHLSRAGFLFPRGVRRPVIGQVTAPHTAADASNATATVTLDISEKGEPFNVRIDKSSDQSSDDDWSRSVADAVRQWKFTPASLNGHPVTVSCTLDFVRGH